MSDTNTKPSTKTITEVIEGVTIKVGPELAIVRVHKPAHERKSAATGEIKIVPEKNTYRAAAPQPGQVGLFFQALCTSAGDITKQTALVERILGPYLTEMSEQGQVTKPDGTTVWDEQAYAKALSNPTPPRRAGASIDDLTEQHSEILSLLAKIADVLIAIQNGDQPDFSELSAALGREVSQMDQIYVMFSDSKRNLGRIEAAIKEKRDAANKAKLTREAKKAAAPVAS